MAEFSTAGARRGDGELLFVGTPEEFREFIGSMVGHGDAEQSRAVEDLLELTDAMVGSTLGDRAATGRVDEHPEFGSVVQRPEDDVCLLEGDRVSIVAAGGILGIAFEVSEDRESEDLIGVLSRYELSRLPGTGTAKPKVRWYRCRNNHLHRSRDASGSPCPDCGEPLRQVA